MPRDYEEFAPHYATMHRRWLRYAGGAAQAAFEAAVIARIGPGVRVLDAGCGTGEFARHLLAVQPALELTICDKSPAMMEAAKDVAAAQTQACLLRLPFDTAEFDVVAAAWSIETTADPARAVRELVRVLRPGGVLVLAFCSSDPAQSLSAKVLKESVRWRGFGRFLDASAIARASEIAGGAVTRLRADGPAAALLARKAMLEERAA